MPLLKYGQVIRSIENPLEGILIVGGRQVNPHVGEFFISKYDKNDIDAEMYKVILIPTQKYKHRFPMIVYESIDLLNKIKSGEAVIISE